MPEERSDLSSLLDSAVEIEESEIGTGQQVGDEDLESLLDTAVEVESEGESQIVEDGFSFDRVKAAREFGKLQTELGLLRAQEIYGNESPELSEKIAAIKSQMDLLSDPHAKDRGWIERAVAGAAKMTPIMESGLKTGVKRGVTTGAAGGLAALVGGQMGPQALFPEEAVTVPLTAGTAFAVGLTHGTMQNIGEIEAGLFYDEMVELVDEAGNKIDPTTAKTFAAAVGAINAALEMSQISTLVKTFPGGRAALNRLISGTAKKIIKKGATRKGVLEIAKAVGKEGVKYAKTIGDETVQELLQETTSIVAGEVAKKVNNELRGTELEGATGEQILARMVDTAVESALSFSVLSAPGHIYTGAKKAKKAMKSDVDLLAGPDTSGTKTYQHEDLGIQAERDQLAALHNKLRQGEALSEEEVKILHEIQGSEQVAEEEYVPVETAEEPNALTPPDVKPALPAPDQINMPGTIQLGGPQTVDLRSPVDEHQMGQEPPAGETVQHDPLVDLERQPAVQAVAEAKRNLSGLIELAKDAKAAGKSFTEFTKEIRSNPLAHGFVTEKGTTDQLGITAALQKAGVGTLREIYANIDSLIEQTPEEATTEEVVEEPNAEASTEDEVSHEEPPEPSGEAEAEIQEDSDAERWAGDRAQAKEFIDTEEKQVETQKRLFEYKELATDEEWNNAQVNGVDTAIELGFEPGTDDFAEAAAFYARATLEGEYDIGTRRGRVLTEQEAAPETTEQQVVTKPKPAKKEAKKPTKKPAKKSVEKTEEKDETEPDTTPKDEAKDELAQAQEDLKDAKWALQNASTKEERSDAAEEVKRLKAKVEELGGTKLSAAKPADKKQPKEEAEQKDRPIVAKAKEKLKRDLPDGREDLVDEIHEVEPPNKIVRQIAVAFKELFNVETIFLSGLTEAGADGAFMRGLSRNTIFIDATTGIKLHQVMGHELMHLLEVRNPLMYRQFKGVVLQYMKNTGRYQRELNELRAGKQGMDELDYSHAMDELLADMVGSQLMDSSFWHVLEEYAPKKKDVIKYVAKRFHDMIEKVVAFFNEMTGSKPRDFIKDLEIVQDVTAQYLGLAIEEASDTQQPVETRVGTEAAEEETKFNLTDQDIRDLKILRPALKTDSGIIIGKPGQLHPDMAKIHGVDWRADDYYDVTGFADPDGNFLSREDAFQWMKKNDPIGYAEYTKDYARYGGAELLETISYGKAKGLTMDEDVLFSLSDQELKDLKILRPAIKHNGQLLIGKPGETHPSLAFQSRTSMPEEDWISSTGFVDPDGNWLGREEALQWLQENEPEVYRDYTERTAIKLMESITYAYAKGLVEKNRTLFSLSEQDIKDLKILRPAIKLKGQIHIGNPTTSHPKMLYEIGGAWDEVEYFNETGFVDPDGKWLTREEAIQWMKDNVPDVWKEYKDKGNTLNFLESVGYAHAAGLKTEDETDFSVSTKVAKEAFEDMGFTVDKNNDVFNTKGKNIGNLEKLSPWQKWQIYAMAKVINPLDGIINGMRHLPQRSHYEIRRWKALGQLEALERESHEIFSILRKATSDQAKVIYKYLTTKDAKASMLPAEFRERTVKIKDQIIEIGRQLVDKKILHEKSLEEHEGKYLPRVYLKYLVGEDAADVLTSGSGKGLDLKYTKKRKDIPKAIRKYLLGEIEDPAFLASRAYAVPMRDIVLHDLMSDIARNKSWTFPRVIVDWSHDERAWRKYGTLHYRENPDGTYDVVLSERKTTETKLDNVQPTNLSRLIDKDLARAILNNKGKPVVVSSKGEHRLSPWRDVGGGVKWRRNNDGSINVRLKERVDVNQTFDSISGDELQTVLTDHHATIVQEGQGRLIGGRMMTPLHMLKEAQHMEKMALSMPEEDAAETQRLAARMRKEALRVIESVKADYGIDLEDPASMPDEWAQVPNTKRYGTLRGAVVRKEIYDDLVGNVNFAIGERGWLENLLSDGGRLSKFHSLWKWKNTAMNITAQARNWISNTMLIHMSGVPMVRLPDLYIKAVQQIAAQARGDDPSKYVHWDVARRYGMKKASFSAVEMGRIETEFLDTVSRTADETPAAFAMRRLHHMFAKLYNFSGDVYQFGEAVGKTVIIIHAMEKGMSEEQAAAKGHKWLFDYSLTNRSIKTARSGIIGSPFLTFSLKVLPRMLEVALTAPWRLTPYIAATYGLQALVASMFDVDEDDMRKLKKALPKWIREKSHAYFLPVKDAAGRWQVIDLGYIFPWGGWMEAAKGLARGDIKTAVQPVTLGGPLSDLITLWNTGIDSFTQEPIFEPDDTTPVDKLGALLRYSYAYLAPPFLTERGPLRRGWQAVSGEVDMFGEPRVTGMQALLRWAGVNIYSYHPEISRTFNLMAMQEEFQEVSFHYQKQLADRNLNAAERAKIMRKAEKKLKELSGKIQEYAEESEIHPNLK